MRARSQSPSNPRRLVVRVVQPSGAIGPHRDAVERGIERLEHSHCEVRWDDRRAQASWRGYLAGDDDARATEFLDALTEPGVDVVWFARGGVGAGRIAQRVLAEARHLAPRAVVGFSDATALIDPLAALLGWVTYHDPVVSSLGRPDTFTIDLDEAISVLSGTQETIAVPVCSGPEVQGVLLGGNLSVLASLAGTAAWPHQKGALWLIEEVGEAPYRIDRLFQQLQDAGLFREAAGIWLGDLGVSSSDTPSVLEAIQQDVGDLSVWRDAPAGHRGTIALLPLGVQVRLSPQTGLLHVPGLRCL